MTDALSMDQKPETRITSRMSVLRIRNFRLLWIGEGISLLGDQFYVIALPWLVLSLTGKARAVGTPARRTTGIRQSADARRSQPVSLLGSIAIDRSLRRAMCEVHTVESPTGVTRTDRKGNIP